MSNHPASTRPPQQAQRPAPQHPIAYSPPRTYAPPAGFASPSYLPIQQSFVGSPVQYIPQPVAVQPVAVQPVAVQPVAVQPAQQVIKGESRIEYIPYEKSVIEYEEVRQRIQVPREKYVTEYQAIEYQTEYIPQVFYDKVTEYIPVDRFQDRVEYYPVERQVVHQPVQQVVAQPVVQSVVQQVPQYVAPVQSVVQPVFQQPQFQYAPYVQPNFAPSRIAPVSYAPPLSYGHPVSHPRRHVNSYVNHQSPPAKPLPAQKPQPQKEKKSFLDNIFS
uniref:EPI35 protein n=1 Tax=Paramecium tetraurelia TaxID=5888 RepID=Q3SDG6_PARTE|nr:EPI35 [Paramecium tetraurelia]